MEENTRPAMPVCMPRTRLLSTVRPSAAASPSDCMSLVRMPRPPEFGEQLFLLQSKESACRQQRRSSAAEQVFDALDFRGELTGVARPDVGLEHQADPGR